MAHLLSKIEHLMISCSKAAFHFLRWKVLLRIVRLLSLGLRLYYDTCWWRDFSLLYSGLSLNYHRWGRYIQFVILRHFLQVFVHYTLLLRNEDYRRWYWKLARIFETVFFMDLIWRFDRNCLLLLLNLHLLLLLECLDSFLDTLHYFAKNLRLSAENHVLKLLYQYFLRRLFRLHIGHFDFDFW